MKLTLKAARLSAAVLALSAPFLVLNSFPQVSFAQESGGNEAAISEAQSILNDAGNLAALAEGDIKARIKSARKLARSEGLPDDMKSALEGFVATARQELITRKSQSEQPAQDQQAEQPSQDQQTEQPAEAQSPPQPTVDEASLAEAQEILRRANDMASLSEENIKVDIKAARRLARDSGVPEDVRSALENYVASARKELVTRQAQQQEQPAQEQQPAQQQTQEVPVEAPAAPEAQQQPADAQVDESALAQAQTILNEGSALASMGEDDIKNRIKAARRLSRAEGIGDDVKTALQGFIDSARQELITRQAKSQQQTDQQAAEQPATDQSQPLSVEEAPAAPTPPKSEAENRAVEKPDVSREAEAKAAAFLADDTSVEKMKDEALRERLEAYRELLDDGELSRETERNLRKKLKNEREILRARIAARELAEQQAAAAKQQSGATAEESSSQGTKKAGKRQPDVNFNGPVTIVRLDQRPTREEIEFVVRDRRPLADLSEVELNRRIFIYRDLARDERYQPGQLVMIRGELVKSRRELHRRYEAEKIHRRRDIDRRRKRNELDIDINVDVGFGASAPPPVIWAAEEDDEEIERQLVARPRQPIERTYPREVLFDEPEVVLTRPEVRESLPSVELDTITFGFNEAFVREEEVAKLDRVGSIIERIVAAHPREAFVIEGHTDAVGSDAYNLKLSRLRAIAIKDVLLEFYNIDEGNLTTVGLGERYLKIPTPEPEQENRRGTIRRITPLVSGYDPEEPDE
jgi:outer membrane protein OmpA-like peptidoglycan-associated protein